MLQTFRQTQGKVMAAARHTQSALAAFRYCLQGWLLPASKKPPAKALRGIAAHDPEFRQLSFTFAVIALSARIACAGTPLSREKYLAFRAAFPLKGSICGTIRSLFELACTNTTPVEHYVRQIKFAFPSQPALFSSLVDRLFAIAAADGGVAPEAENLLARIAHLLSVSPLEYTKIRARYERPPTAHEVLGMSEKSSTGALKRRYRELLQRYHPDRFAGDQLSPEVETMLRLKTSEITRAYKTLSRRAA